MPLDHHWPEPMSIETTTFEEYAYSSVSETRKKRSTNIFHLDGAVYAFGSTTIDLCLSLFCWAKRYQSAYII